MEHFEFGAQGQMSQCADLKLWKSKPVLHSQQQVALVKKQVLTDIR